MSDMVDVAIIGAGPYGLALAAHLRAAGVDYRHFGIPMRLWEAAMPKGMFLKSQGFASNLADPEGTHTLEAFCKATSRPYASYGLPVSLDTFVSYGHWFQSERGLAIEETLVSDIALRDGGFELTVGGVERVLARKVVVAIGVEHFAYVPEPFVRAALRPVHAQFRAPGSGALSRARRLSSSALVSPRWSRPRCCMRAVPRCRFWSGRARWPGTASRSRSTGRCSSG